MVCWLLLFFVVIVQSTPRYHLVALDGTNAFPLSICRDLVAGSVGDAPATWNAHTGELLAEACGPYGVARDVAADGTIVGHNLNELRMAWAQTGERCEWLESLPGIGFAPLSVSASGMLAGEAWNDAAQILYAVRWDDYRLQPLFLPDLGGNVNTAQEINAHGIAVGFVNDPKPPWDGRARACLWTQEGALVLLPQPATFQGESVASAISDSGLIVGRIALGRGNFVPWQAVLWPAGERAEPILLGTLPGMMHSWALGVNSDGEVVGASANDPWTGKAFIWSRAGGMRALTLLTDAPEWHLVIAHDVDDTGRITGWGWLNGEVRGYVLVPLAEQAASRKDKHAD